MFVAGRLLLGLAAYQLENMADSPTYVILCIYCVFTCCHLMHISLFY